MFFPNKSWPIHSSWLALAPWTKGEIICPQNRNHLINSKSPNSFLNGWLSDSVTNDTVDNMLLLQAHNTTG